jgi:hypothetical protein
MGCELKQVCCYHGLNELLIWLLAQVWTNFRPTSFILLRTGCQALPNKGLWFLSSCSRATTIASKQHGGVVDKHTASIWCQHVSLGSTPAKQQLAPASGQQYSRPCSGPACVRLLQILAYSMPHRRSLVYCSLSQSRGWRSQSVASFRAALK